MDRDFIKLQEVLRRNADSEFCIILSEFLESKIEVERDVLEKAKWNGQNFYRAKGKIQLCRDLLNLLALGKESNE